MKVQSLHSLHGDGCIVLVLGVSQVRRPPRAAAERRNVSQPPSAGARKARWKEIPTENWPLVRREYSTRGYRIHSREYSR